MKPITKPHTTRILFAPRDWDESKNGACGGLPVTDRDGFMYSYWKTSLKDRLTILFGRPIRLAVVGCGHPGVALDTNE